MIASLTGTIEYFTENGVVLDVGGIGFEVQTGVEAMQSLSARGVKETVHLYTFLNTGRDGDLTLYGFLSRNELWLFKMLITVSGIGPKGALALLSSMRAEDLIFAILSGDAKTISRAPGIGKKTAERLVLDLRDKLVKCAREDGSSGSFGSLSAAGATGNRTGSSLPQEDGAQMQNVAAQDAAEALVALGYPRLDAVKAVRQACNELETQGKGSEDAEQLLKTALGYLI